MKGIVTFCHNSSPPSPPTVHKPQSRGFLCQKLLLLNQHTTTAGTTRVPDWHHLKHLLPWGRRFMFLLCWVRVRWCVVGDTLVSRFFMILYIPDTLFSKNPVLLFDESIQGVVGMFAYHSYTFNTFNTIAAYRPGVLFPL